MNHPTRGTIAGLLLAATSAGQSVPQVTLGKPLARSTEGFTEITTVHELPDGRAIAVDQRESRIVVIDWTRGTVTNVSRSGSGPLEFTATFTLIPWVGDTVLVYGRRDLLKIAPNGEPAGRLSVTLGSGLSAPRFADQRGRLYFETTDPLARNTDGSFVAPIHGNVVRWDLRSGTIDTVGELSYRDPKQPLIRPWRPYPKRDASAAFPDGSVAFVRAQDYHVEIWRDGSLATRGPRIATERIPITAAERDAFRDERAQRGRGGVRVEGPARASEADRQASRDAARRELDIPEAAFPPELPPFVEDRATLVDPNGLLWVMRSFRGDETMRSYDVFDGRGVLVKRVIVPRRGRLVGFGKNTIYAVIPDEDDVQWVERYVMPR